MARMGRPGLSSAQKAELWARTDLVDTEFALRLYRDFNVTVLPGSYLAHEAHSVNPGLGFLRLALVASLEAAKRITQL